MGGWNFADVWECVADARSDQVAVAQGDRRLRWGELDRRADGVARALLAAGLGHQDKVALHLYNGPEYLEVLFGAGKAGLVPVNTNYRYLGDELVHVWANADAAAVVFHGSLADRVAEVRDRVPNVRTWLWVDDGSGPCPPWATPYEDAILAGATEPGRARPPWGRTGDDLLLLYTGGTTGRPKGVMWRQDDLYRLIAAGPAGDPPDADLGAVRRRLADPARARRVGLPACPLMHGTGSFVAMTELSTGGTVVLLPSRSYDAVELLDAVDREGVTVAAIVGDAFARPLLAALDDHPGRWSLSSLRFLLSSGAICSEPVKQGLVARVPHLRVVDLFGSSEAVGIAAAVTTAGGGAPTARFRLGPRTRVVTDDGRDVAPGSGEVGLLAVRGPGPLGYYKDPEASGQVFRQLDGDRWVMPGDHATVEPDGTIHLLGRGSSCINTGGEKVYAEEVEEVLKEHPAVGDAAVVGVPDDRLGEVVCAVVEPAAPADVPFDLDEVVAHVRGRLAGYKAPRRALVVDRVPRVPSGKVDYAGLRTEAARRSAAVSPPAPPGRP